ncbi:MAG: molybdopterin-dependent oxidoreductase, partial [Candidatus Dormiibacterota bacterium]
RRRPAPRRPRRRDRRPAAEASQHADQTVLVRPGSDAALALGMLGVIVREDLWDHDFVAAHTTGFEELAAHVRPMTPEWTARETGVEPDVIVELARSYARSRRSVILLGGSSMHKTGATWHAARAITCLPAVTGSLGRPGAGFGPRHGAGTGSNAMTSIVPPSRLDPEKAITSEMSTIVDRLERGDVDVLFLAGTNMRSSFTGGDRLGKALAKTRLVVCVDLFMSDTARAYADVVLPGTAWLEEQGFKLGPTHLHLMDQVLAPRGEARPLWRIYRDLADRLQVDDFFPWRDAEGLVDALLDTDLIGHRTAAQIRAGGPSVRTAAPDYAYASLEFPTPSGRVELRSSEAARLGLPALPTYEPARGDPYPLQFVQGRTLTHFHAFYDHGRALPSLHAADPEPMLWISPPDAAERAIADRQEIRLHNARGEMAARALVTERVPKGTVWMRDGWLGINDLTRPDRTVPDVAVQAFAPSGSAAFDARIEVSPAAPTR